ncbi:hypothetical protein ACPA2L_08620 [Bacillus bombysepticus]
MGDVDVSAMIFTSVVAKRNRSVSVKNVIVKQKRNAIVGMKRKGINNKKSTMRTLFLGDYIPS